MFRGRNKYVVISLVLLVILGFFYFLGKWTVFKPELYSEEKTYVTANEKDQYYFQKELERNGKTYQLQDTTYEMLEERYTQPLTHTVEVKDLSTQEFSAEEQISIEHDGKQVQLKLKEVNYEAQPITGRKQRVSKYVTYEKAFNQSPVESTAQSEFTDELTGARRTVTLPLSNIRIKNGYYWLSDVRIPVKFRVYNADYYVLPNGQIIKRNEAKPQLQGYEDYFVSYLGLNRDHYRINDFVWDGGIYTEGGVQYRNAVATGERYVADFEGEYSSEISLPDVERYTAKAQYISEDNVAGPKEYRVKAVAYYQVDTLTKDVIIGSVLVVALIVLILYVLAQRREKEGDN